MAGPELNLGSESKTGMTGTVALVLQGLQVGGMERCALRIARSARLSGYEARLVLYDSPSTRGSDEYDPGDIPVVFVPRSAGIDITLPVRLARLFRQWNVDVVHARNNVAGFYSALALMLMTPSPGLVITFDTFPGEGTAKARLGSRWASERASVIASVSYDLSRRLVRSGWVTACQTVWNGVDHRYFNPDGPRYGVREKLGLRSETIVIGNVARLDLNKRQIDLVEAFDHVRASEPSIALAIAGDGPSQNVVAQAVQSVRNAFLLGTVHEVAEFLRDIDIFVLCSDDEGCPCALLEAMACGKAIIATSVGGISEILDGCGLLVPRRDPSKMAAAIARLHGSPELRVHLGEAARSKIMRSFTLEHEWHRYEAIYRSALS